MTRASLLLVQEYDKLVERRSRCESDIDAARTTIENRRDMIADLNAQIGEICAAISLLKTETPNT